MYKRLLALIPVLVFVCALSIPVHADSVVSNQDLHFQCSSCSYTASLDAITWVGDSAKMTCPECGGRLGIYQGETFIPGGGVTRGGGAGRDVPGYVGEGVTNYDSSGFLQYFVWPEFSPDGSTWYSYPYDFTFTSSYGFYRVFGDTISTTCTTSASYTLFSYDFYLRFPVVAPLTGLYYISYQQYYLSNIWSVNNASKASDYYLRANSLSQKLTSGQTYYFPSNSYYSYKNNAAIYYSYTPPAQFDSKIQPVVFTVVPDSSSLSKTTNITINDYTFNGNIYVDSDTNITYIYPDNSTTCIVYDNTSNQYITYNNTTNYYYYVTEVTEPEPTPSPTPDPGGSGDGGDGGDGGSGPGGSGSGGGSGGSSNPLGGLLGGLLGALGDLLLGLLQSFLNLIWTLISTILSIFLWCGQQVAVLIPFLPAPALGALLGGIVLVFIIKLVKFIGGLF